MAQPVLCAKSGRIHPFSRNEVGDTPRRTDPTPGPVGREAGDDARQATSVSGGGFDRAVPAEMVRQVVARPDPEWPVGTHVAELEHFGDWLVTSIERGESPGRPPVDR